jgi:hypothetical protein
VAIERKDLVLDKAVPTDATVIPRYRGVNESGTVVFQHVKLELENPVVQPATDVNKPLIDEILAASGLVEGEGTLTLVQPGYDWYNGGEVRFQIQNQIAGPTTLNVNGRGDFPIYSHEWADPEYFAPGTWITVIFAIHPETGEKAYIIQGGGSGRGTLHIFSELDDIQICCGRIQNGGSGWNSFTFPREFDGVPTVSAQLVGAEGFILFNNITKTGFQYQVRVPGVNISATTGTYYTAAGTAASSTHSAVTLVSAVSGSFASSATASALEIMYQAIYDGGED